MSDPKQQALLNSIMIAVGALVFARFMGTFLYQWFTDWMAAKSEKRSYEDLDKVIEGRKIFFKKGIMEAKEPVTKSDVKKVYQIDESEEIKEQKKLIQKILSFPTTPKASQTKEQFYAGILELPLGASGSIAKSQYRKMVMQWHPDRFDLQEFDVKTKTLLEKRINQNFNLITEAFEFYKKAA